MAPLRAVGKMSTPHTPHGPGFRFLDSFRTADGKGIGEWTPEPDLWFFRDHFPGRPLVPAVLLLEFAAQAAGALWMQGGGSPETPLFLAGTDGLKVKSPALPGETLVAQVETIREFGPLAQFSFTITAAGRPVAEGRVTMARHAGGG